MLDVCSATLVSGSDLCKLWRGTHILNASARSAIVVSGYDLLKQWREIHSLDELSAILVSGSYLLRY